MLYELVKTTASNLQLSLENIIAECFDGAANMSGAHKGLAARMKECSPLSLYVHCYGHRLNLTLQGTMTEIELLRNALGVVQSLYNFLEASPKRHVLFKSIQVESDDEDVARTIKSLSVTRWACCWAAVKAISTKMPKIIDALIRLSGDKDPKTYRDSNSLLHSICDFPFVFGLMLLKNNLSNTDGLSRYLEDGKKTVDAVVETLNKCRNEESFNLLWSRALIMAEEIKKGIDDTEFTFREAEVPRKELIRPSRRPQAWLAKRLKQMMKYRIGLQKTTIVSLATIQVLTKLSQR